MASFDSAYFDIKYLDTLSYQDTAIHRLDPRVKLLTTAIFILTVVSFSKYELTALAPLLVFPVILVSRAALPVGLLFKKIVAVSPFAVLVGAFNPLFDQQIELYLGGVPVSGGWISFASILILSLIHI